MMRAPARDPAPDSTAIVLFDGVCVLCSRWYRFVHARDRAGRFRFVPIQQPEGRALAERHGIDPADPQTFVLIEDNGVRFRSDAALAILARLPHWRWTSALRVVPASLRDRVYDAVARNRYRWFGRLDACLLPAASTEPTER